MFHLTPEYGAHIFEWTGSKCYKQLLFSDLFEMYLKQLWVLICGWGTPEGERLQMCHSS